MTTAIVAGLLAGYGIAVPVGAIGTYLVALTARTSLRVGLAAALGVATADGLFALAAVLGGSSLAGTIAPYADALRWLAVAVLVVLAAHVARAAGRAYRATDPAGRVEAHAVSPARAYTSLLAVTLVNPVTVVYFAALVVAGGQSVAAGPAERAAFVLAAFAASASWQVLLAGSGALVGRALTGRRGRLWTGLVSSAVMLGFAARLTAG